MHHKISKIEKRVNHIQIGLVILLVLLCLTSSIGYYFVHSKYGLRTENSYIPSLNMILSLECKISLIEPLLCSSLSSCS